MRCRLGHAYIVILVLLLASCTGGQPLPPTSTILVLPSAPPTAPPSATPTTIPSSPTPTQSLPTSTPIPSETPVDLQSLPGFGYGPDTFPADVNPLTGLKVVDPRLLERRPLMIKITNFPRDVRPQWGLNVADHVYEYYLEDDLTRFIGIFYGQEASRVGPVRSARPFDLEVLRMYKAIFAFGYGDDFVVDMLMESEMRSFLVVERPDNCPPLCRDVYRSDYNNLFTDTAQLGQYITDRGIDNSRQDLSGLRFEANSLVTYGGGAVPRLFVRYSNESYHRWEYDPISQRYLRWQETVSLASRQEDYAPLFDSLTGQQVYADNIVIVLAPIHYLYKSKSTEIFGTDLMGTGDAYAMRQGRMFSIQWRRDAASALITLRFPGGAPYPLKPGNTWFIVLGETSYHEIQPDGGWRFTFSMP
ncbi:MAG: DUF3048 domain-containing protein [Chloroflexota bacterium]